MPIHCGSTEREDGLLTAKDIFAVKTHLRSPMQVLPDIEDMKAKLREQQLKPVYDVANFYHTTGCAQRIARSVYFEWATLLVIAFNALWIAIETDNNDAELLIDAPLEFMVMENIFCTYFSCEWIIRFLAFRRKRDGLRDAWFVFDTMLVTTMIIETWIMTLILALSGSGSSSNLGDTSMLRLLRLLRLTRMARMARLLRSMPELLILVKGMVAAFRSVFFTLCLLFIVLYVFGIIFRQLTKSNPPSDLSVNHFSSVTHSMHTLLLYGTFLDDLASFALEVEQASYTYLAVFYIFVLLSALTVMNMLIGVLCEVVSAVAQTEREELAVTYVKGKLHEIIQAHGLDKDGDCHVSKAELMTVLQIPEASKLLTEVGVDVVGLVDVADFIFENEELNTGEEESMLVIGSGGQKKLSFPEFMEVIMQLRGSNNATVKDIVDLRKFVRKESQATAKNMMRLEEKVHAQLNSVKMSVSLSGSESPRAPSRFSIGDPAPPCIRPPSRYALDHQDFNGHAEDICLKTERLEQALSIGQRELHRFLDNLPCNGSGFNTQDQNTPWLSLEPRELAVMETMQESLASGLNILQRVRSRISYGTNGF